MIDVVSATRLPEDRFWSESALGQSLRRLAFDLRLRPRISFENRRGLPEVYNAALAAPDCAPSVVFVHDDVWLDDHFFAARILDGLQAFDIIGLAGNRRCPPGHVGWGVIGESLAWDDLAHLTGIIAHGMHPCGPVSCFGAVPAECELLDGVLLAANAQALRDKAVRFDPQFDFHFYDLDFCRAARRAGLRLGTWPVAVTHQSGGAFGSPQWSQLLRAYQQKWGV